MPETPIEQVSDLKPFLARLQALGYKNTDQLKGVHKASAQNLADYLQTSLVTLKTVVDNLPNTPTTFAAGPPHFRALGVQLDRIPRSMIAFSIAPPSAAPLPPMVNWINEMQPIRDQSVRGTCVAHSSTAAMEHFYHKAGRILDLSRQFLYWDCKAHDGSPGEGTWVAVAMDCLEREGCCLETTWPYNSAKVPGNEGQGPAPATAATEALTIKIPSFTLIAPTSVHDIKASLASHRCVAFSIPVFNSWYQNDDVTLTGNIVNPLPGELQAGGHSMCMVGYEDLPLETALGGGRFYIRNSWNAFWGTACPLGVGYGTIPYSYIARFGSEAYSIG